jgi:hypothetical protein
LGGAASGPEPEEVQLAEDLTKKCLTFELQFDSNGIFDAVAGDGYSAAVTAKIRLQFDPATLTIKGEAPLESKSFEFRPPASCTATSTTGGGSFQVNSLEYVTDSTSKDDKLGFVSDFKLDYWPGVTTESYHVDCPPTGSSKQEAHFTSPPSGYWSGMFFVTHTDELNTLGAASGAAPALPDISSMLSGALAGAIPPLPVPDLGGGGGFLADDWEVMGGELFAQKEWDMNQSGASVVENGSMKLFHTPGN